MGEFTALFLFFAGAQGLVLSIILMLSGIKSDKSRLFMGLICFVIALELMNAWAMSFSYHSKPYPFPFWLFGSYLIIPAALYGFVRYSFKIHQKKLPATWVWFIPAVIEIVLEFCAFYLAKWNVAYFELTTYEAWFFFTEVLPIIAMIVVLVLFFMQWKSLLSKAKPKKVKLIQFIKFIGLWIVFAVITVLWVMQSLLGIQVFFYIELVLSILLFALGYVVFFFPDFYAAVTLANDKEEQVSFVYDDTEQLEKLKTLFEEQRLFEKPRLSLKQVASEMQMPMRYVSHLINSYHQQDFRTFVNTHRVEAVKVKMKNPKEQHKTLLSLAMECGFNSKSSFNQIFKQITGQKPSEYHQKVVE